MSVDREVLELRIRVAKLERQVAFLLDHLALDYREEPNGASPEVIELLRSGKKIQAVKLFRQEMGVGLREAKEFIESLEV